MSSTRLLSMQAKVCGRCRCLYTEEEPCKCGGKQIDDRDNSAARGYTTKWKRFRERLFKQRAKRGVLCAACGLAFGAEGFHADHIEPVQSADDPLFYEPTNIQFLHPSCHSKKTRQDESDGKTRKMGE